MNREKLEKWGYAAGTGIIVIVLAAYKFRFLSLPYFWDEAWPYSVAVHAMYNHGLSLLPSAIPSFISRGHPLMFHFLAAGWMTVFGTGLAAGHSFALFVSLLLVGVVYIFCSSFFSRRVGLIAALLTASLPIIITQAAFLMPEGLMGLWTMLCFYTYFRQRNALFVIVATAMLLTKESGCVLILTLGFCEIVFYLAHKEKSVAALLRRLGLIALPAGLAFIYFCIQKAQYGFFLYPFYMDYMTSEWTKIASDLPSAMAYLFVYDGRNGLSLAIIVSVAILFFRGRKLPGPEQRILLTLSIYLVFYLLFSSVNYYIPRYLLCCFAPFVVVGSVLIDRAFSVKAALIPFVVAGLAATNIFFYSQVKKNGDMDYTCSINADMMVVQFFEQAQLTNHYLLVPPVLRIDMAEPYAGYLSGKPFGNIQAGFTDKTEYCVQTNLQDESDMYANLKQQYKLQLVKRIEVGYAWRDIYRVER